MGYLNHGSSLQTLVEMYTESRRSGKMKIRISPAPALRAQPPYATSIRHAARRTSALRGVLNVNHLNVPLRRPPPPPVTTKRTHFQLFHLVVPAPGLNWIIINLSAADGLLAVTAVNYKLVFVLDFFRGRANGARTISTFSE
ncbi:hypothetical protein EVAR_102190_1 [Eumeta japonica]|uniref:Uncharacterized protein n=1 Tax=Eumeta variegata TaxID=151549 RepID=A0A4C2ACH9_EUMVA|nr:hypothetical protein EVAR_102190_1 [Eumeta japonica]